MSTHRQIITSLIALGLVAGCFALTATPSFAGQREYPEQVTETFGSTGTGNGQFTDPTGIAVNETTGDVYVVDKGNNRVQVFGPEGKYLSQFNGSSTPAGSFSGSSSIAIDNSTDAAKGDVYVTNNGHNVVDVFNAAGTYLYQLTGIASGPYSGPFTYLSGVSVDGNGNIWVTQNLSGGYGRYCGGATEYRESCGLDEFNDAGSFILQVPDSEYEYVGIAAESDEALYPIKLPYPGKGNGGSGEVLKINETGEYFGHYELSSVSIVEPEFGGVAVDMASHYVFFDVPGGIEEFAPFEGVSTFPKQGFGSPFDVFATKGLGESRGIAVDGATNVVYATETQADRVAIIPPVAIVTEPTVNDLPPAASVTRTTAQISATLNPDNGLGKYHLEYVEAGSYEPEAADPYAAGESTPEVSFGHKLSGSEEEDTDRTIGPLVLQGLKAGTTYDYRLVASNQVGTTIGPDYTFTTSPPTPPVVSTGPASEVTQTSVTLTGTVDPEGLQTSYEFQVGTTTAYEGAELFGNAGQKAGTETIAVNLAYLIPGTTYHYRILATNTDGTTYGQDATFTTPGVPQTIVQPLSEPLLATPKIAFPTVSSKPSKPKTKTKSKKEPKKKTKRKAKSRSKAKK